MINKFIFHQIYLRYTWNSWNSFRC